MNSRMEEGLREERTNTMDMFAGQLEASDDQQANPLTYCGAAARRSGQNHGYNPGCTLHEVMIL
jgi:hypothetical protein